VGNVHQFVGVWIGKRSEENRFRDAEDRDRSADAEAKSENGQDGERRVASKRAKSGQEIVFHGRHLWGPVSRPGRRIPMVQWLGLSQSGP
jgi:hypothetical protein